MAEVASAYVSLIPSFKGGSQAISKQLAGPLDGAGREGGQRYGQGMAAGVAGMAKSIFAPLAAAAGGVALFGFAKDAIGEASGLNESINALNVSYGAASAGVQALGREAANSLGLSNLEFNNLAVRFSSFSKTIAGEGGNVTGTLDDLTKRASDFASVMNLEVSEAAQIFQSGLAGESEPLRKFGIDMSAATVAAYAVANGISASAASMTEAEKVQARYGLLMESTAASAGDFANTSGELANRQRILSARFADLRAKVGAGMLPAMTSVVSFMADKMLPTFERVIGGVGQIGSAFAAGLSGDTSSFDGFLGGIAGVGSAVGNLVEWFRTDAAAGIGSLVAAFRTGASGVASSGFGAAMEGIGLAARAVLGFFTDTVVPGIRAMVAAFQAGGDDITSSGFAGVMERVGLAARGLVDFLTGTIVPGIRAFVAAFRAGGDDITSNGFAGGMERVALGMRGFVDFVTGTVIPGVQAMVAAFQRGGTAIASTGFAGVMERIGLGLRGFTNFVTTTVLPAVGALVAAFVVGGDQITGAGFAGAMGDIGVAVRAVAGFLVGTLAPALVGAAVYLNENATAARVLAGVVGAVLLPVFLSMTAAAVTSATAQVTAWAATRTASVTSSAAQLASHYKVVAGWALSGAAAARSGATTVAIWALYQAQAVRSAAATVAAHATIAAAWVASGVRATASAAATVGALAVQNTALVASRAVMIASAAATGLVTAAQWAWNAALTANPIGIVVVAIAALVAGLIYAWNNSETFRKIVTGAWEAIKTAASAVAAWFKNTIPPLWDTIVAGTTRAWDGIVSFFRGIPGKIMQAFLNFTLPGLLIKHWDAIRTGATQAWDSIVAWLRGVPALIAGAFTNFTLIGLLVKHWGAIRAGVVTAWDSIVSWVQGIPGRLVQVFTNFTLIGLLVKHWDTIKSGAVTGFTGLVDYVKGIPARIVQAFGNLTDALFTAGQDLIGGLVRGISSKVTAPVKAVKEAVGSVISGAKNMLGIASPSRVFMEIGAFTGEGLALGLTRERDRVKRATDNLISIPDGATVNVNRAGLAGNAATAGGPTTTMLNTYNNPVFTDPNAATEHASQSLRNLTGRR